MMRADECYVPVRLGDDPPWIPLRKPFDATGWQVAATLLTVGLTFGLDNWIHLDDTPFQEGTLISPMMLARVVVLTLGMSFVIVHPGGRWMHLWLFVALKHWFLRSDAVYDVYDDPRGATYFPVDAEKMLRMRLQGESLTFVREPPFWRIMQHTPWKTTYWEHHVPHRMMIPVDAQGAIELMTDSDRASRWAGFTAGIKATTYPVQIVAQCRPEDPDWLVEHTMPPVGSRFAFLRAAIERWMRQRAVALTRRRIVVVCSAPSADKLVEHVRDVTGALTDAGLQVRETKLDEMHDILDSVLGTRKYFPHSTTSFGIDNTDWVTIVVRYFPRNVVVAWIMYIVSGLPVDIGLFFEPDDAAWVTKIMEWFEGACMLPTAATEHRDALADLQYVEAKLKRNEDSVQRVTLALTMPKAFAPRVKNRLRKANAIFREATFEHMQGRWATLPIGGLPPLGPTRPYLGETVAAVHPFGQSGLRNNGFVLGTARGAQEVVMLDIEDKALYAKMIAMLGATGAGKTFLIQMLIVRSGLPFTLIDLKPHLSERKHGDYWPLMRACGGDYIVVTDPLDIPYVESDAICYNLASLNQQQQAEALAYIAEYEWARQLDSLTPRIFGCDEANVLAKTHAGRDFIERVATQGRNANIVGVFASQEAWDFLKNEQTRKAISMSPVLIVLAQAPNEVASIVAALQLGDAASAEVMKFQPNPGDTDAARVRNAVMRIGRRVVSFKIEACPEEQTLYTTDPDEKRARRVEMVAA
jgi:hypothetical protein